MLDIVQPNQDFSAFDFAERASQLIENAQTPPIVVGGTGFYFDSLLYPPEFGGTDKQLRKISNGNWMSTDCSICRKN